MDTLLSPAGPLIANGGADRPQESVAHQPLEHRMSPDPLVVAIRGVEDAPFALFAHPRPRLAAAVVDPLHQHRLVRIDFRVDVSFIPDLEWLDSVEHRMIG